MTVGELIEVLSKFDSKLPVLAPREVFGGIGYEQPVVRVGKMSAAELKYGPERPVGAFPTGQVSVVLIS